MVSHAKLMRMVDESLGNPATIHLQGLGAVLAIPADQLEPGMLLSWNYSYKGYEVVSIDRHTQHYLWITERNRKTGQESTRKLKRDRLVAARKPS